MHNIPLEERERERESGESAGRRMCIWERLHLFYFILEDGRLVGKTIILQTGQISSLQKKDGSACADRKIHELQLGRLYC